MITFLISQTTEIADNQKKERITLEHHYREKEEAWDLRAYIL